MKFIVTLIVIVAVFFGGMVLYKKYFKKETSATKPIPEQVVEDKTQTKPAVTTEVKKPTSTEGTAFKKMNSLTKKSTPSSNDGQPTTLITADTPIKHSRWGKKIDKIYMKHNAALEKAAKDE
jgi:hypothetical protein